MNLIAELQRRSVLRAATLYVAAAWELAQGDLKSRGQLKLRKG